MLPRDSSMARVKFSSEHRPQHEAEQQRRWFTLELHEDVPEQRDGDEESSTSIVLFASEKVPIAQNIMMAGYMIR